MWALIGTYILLITLQYEFKLFLRKRDRRELLLQRSRNLFSNLLKEVSSSFVTDLTSDITMYFFTNHLGKAESLGPLNHVMLKITTLLEMGTTI